MPAWGVPLLVTVTTTGVVATPSAGSRVLPGATWMARPEETSVQAPDWQRKVGDPLWQACPSQAVSAQSIFPLQSLSTPSVQLTSVVDPGGLGAQTGGVQTEGVAPVHVPAPPPVSVQAWLAHPASTPQSAAQSSRPPKVIETWLDDAPAVARTTAVPAHESSRRRGREGTPRHAQTPSLSPVHGSGA